MHKIKALQVRQWLKEWDKFDYSQKHSSKPPEHFYIFSLNASQLRALTGVNRRVADANKPQDNIGIQRRHEEERSREIKEFLRNGYPYSSLPRNQKTDASKELRKPGWLPTSIIVNILGPNDKREGKSVNKKELVTVKDLEDGTADISIPFSGDTKNWKYTDYPPIEVIDGQHRLWAFQEDESIDYELPVVAFYNLDISWQAYLFWVINVKPKRINSSLAFDLYPLLRSQDWLEKGSDIHVYRETRAQELVTALWALPASPWHKRINMLGEGGRDMGISQSSWIKSLTAPSSLLGRNGAFEVDSNSWGAAAQVAILIFFGTQLRDHLQNCKKPWLEKLVKAVKGKVRDTKNVAFDTQYSLVGTDQGMRPLLSLLNACILEHLKNRTHWQPARDGEATNPSAVESAIASLNASELGDDIRTLAKKLSTFDWRTAAATDKEKETEAYDVKMGFKGGAGYKQLREKLEVHLGAN